MAIDWTKIPIVQKDMFDTWERFSLGNQNTAKAQAAKFTNPSVASDCVYAYDAANDRVYNTINTTTLVGLVCPDKRDVNFIFDGTLNVFGGGDNDPLGIVIAYVKLPNGETHTLTVMRAMFGQTGPNREPGYWVRSPMTVVKDYMTHAPHLVAESFGVLSFYNGLIVTAENPWVPAGEWNPSNGWVGIAPKGVHMRVVREGDIITVESSQLNETALVPESKITIDLSKDPELEIFRGRSQYGFCSVSQDRVFWTGQVDHPKLATPFWLADVHSMYGTHGWMTDAAEAGGVWKRDPVDLKDVFYKWMRVSLGGSNQEAREAVKYGTVSNKAEMDAFTYDEATNRIGNPINTSTVVGFVSPDKFDSFILDVTMKSSSDWQCDPTGIMIACTYDPDGTFHTLHAIRSSWGPGTLPTQRQMWAEGPFCIILDYMTVGHKVIRKAYGGLRYSSGEVPTAEAPYMTWVGDPGTMWHFEDLPEGVRIRLDRNGDYIALDTSQYNSGDFVSGAKMAIDLRDYPELARFRKPCNYGFCSISQDNIWWDATIRPGGWRRPFWMSEFGKKNEYIRQVRGPFSKSATAAGSDTIGYKPAKHGPINKPLDVIVPLQGFVGADPGYTFAKDATVIGPHMTIADMSAMGFNYNHATCLNRPSKADVTFKTTGHGAVGYMYFKKDAPLQNPIGVAFFDEGDMTTLGTKTIDLPQPTEDMVIVPYIVSDRPVSNISFTIRNK